MPKRYRIGVDIGGTFTDLVMLDTHHGRLFNEKVLTTPDDPSVGVLFGVNKILLTNSVLASDVEHVIHGTTLVANAIIERRGASVALITTRGFRDILQIGTEWRYDTYDLFMELPLPLVPRRLRFEVSERLGPDGAVLTRLDEDDVIRVARELLLSNVTAVAVSFLHSFLNPKHEIIVRDIINREAPKIAVCISSDVMPEIGEYERTSTTVCNAYVLPIFKRYLNKLTDSLRQIGVSNDLYLMLSDGGTVHESTAAAYPIRLVQSGPAGGVKAITAIGLNAGERNLLCFDMGGTTAKACLIDEGHPMRTTEFEVARVYRFKKGSGLPLRVPVIEMIEIGAGGGSIARVDHLGLVQVGPDSASAAPGPACYGLGGLDATVTDADLVLGYISADNFLGGDMKLDRSAAEAALLRAVGEPLSLSAIDAAWAIHETVNESMAQAASIHALEKAKRITDYVMVPIGGAGPVHACNIAMKLGLPKLLCPLGAGVASALGFLVAPVAFTSVKGGVVALNDVNYSALQIILKTMRSKGLKMVQAAGADPNTSTTTYVAAMRYVGQGYEIHVVVNEDILAIKESNKLQDAFDKAYYAQFSRIENGMPIEIVSWSVSVSAVDPDVDLVAGRPIAGVGEAQLGHRLVYFGPKDGFLMSPVYNRYMLITGSSFVGPAVFEERESTTVIPPRSTGYIDSALNLIINLPTDSVMASIN